MGFAYQDFSDPSTKIPAHRQTLTGCISANTEERLFQISSSPILTRLQKARAGLGLNKCMGVGLSLLLSGGMGLVVALVVLGWVVQLASEQGLESRGHSSRCRSQEH